MYITTHLLNPLLTSLEIASPKEIKLPLEQRLKHAIQSLKLK